MSAIIPFDTLKTGDVFDLGTIVFTEAEIIDFASRYDPLPFHTSVEYARNSHFKALVASGPHIFNAFYLREWVPRFGHSVYAGRGVRNWEMLRPVYAGIPYKGTATVISIVPKPERGFAAVTWMFEFTDPENTIVQSLELTVMHVIDT